MHILLTRPQRESIDAALTLKQMGHDVSLVPLLEILPLDEEARDQRIAEILDGGKPDSVICVSKNAVYWGLPKLMERWREAREEASWFALGSGSAEALAALSVESVVPAKSQSESLLDISELQQASGQRVLYIVGENGRTLIENELKTRGADVLRWEVYRRRPDQAAAEQLQRMNRVPDLLTAMSGESLLALDQALPESNRRDWLSKTLLVPSERVAMLARERGFGRVEVVAVTEKDWPLNYLRDEASL